MDETLSLASTSIYHSALSSADSDSPRPFDTPRTKSYPFNSVDSDSQQLLREIEAASLFEQSDSESTPRATNLFDSLDSQQLFQEIQATSPLAALEHRDLRDTSPAITTIDSLNSQQLLQDIQDSSPLATVRQKISEDNPRTISSIESLDSQQLLQDIQDSSPLATVRQKISEDSPRTITSIESLDSQQLLQEIQATSPPVDSPLLERYISSDTVWSSSTTSTLQDTMPATTRLQERREASQTSSRVSSPTHSTSVNNILSHESHNTVSLPSRAPSPIIRTNMLQDLSPHSPSYPSLLQIAVDELVQSLMERGRIKEGHGIRELYLQSFKDPGSAELLDSLLRQQASERQLWDFGRYVEDVNRLESQPPVVVIPVRVQTVAAQTVANRESGGDQRRSTDDVEPATGKNMSPTPQLLPSPRVVIEAPEAATPQASAMLSTQLERMPDRETTSAVANVQARVSRKMRRKERRRIRQAQLSTSAPIDAVHRTIQSLHTLVPNNRSTMPEGGNSLTLRAPDPGENTSVPADLLIQHQHEPRRKKKKRNKMFLGANGPVYSTNVLDVPLSKQIGTFVR